MRASRRNSRRTPRVSTRQQRTMRRNLRRTPRVSRAQVAANHAGRRAERGWHEGRSLRALGHPYRVDRLRFVTGALIRADSHHIAHSTRHRKSRSPRQRARGLRPSCHPALRAGVLGGAESAARERARIDQRLRNRICRRCHSAHASTSRSAFIAVIRGMSLRGEP